MQTASATARSRNQVLGVILRDAALIVGLGAAAGLTANAFRSDPIPWVQSAPYDILVPCPEPVGEATELPATSPLVLDPSSLVIDARGESEFREWHVPQAIHVEFDWLGPPLDPEVALVAKQAAASRARRVLVYGDGDDPDSGREWARLLSGARIKNVFYVRGGAPALQKRMQEGVAP